MRHLEYFHCGYTKVSDLSPLHDARLKQLFLDSTPVQSLEPIRGQPLELLSINGTPIADLTPIEGANIHSFRAIACKNLHRLDALHGQPLKGLAISRSKIESGLREMLADAPLEWIEIDECAPVDLSQLKTRKLRGFRAYGTVVEHMEILAEMQELVLITLPKNTTDPGFLRKLPHLQKIDTVSSSKDIDPKDLKDAAVFWREYDAKQAAGAK